ncbi:MAG: DUF262 domain-containing protein [Treponemataceae bacterium]|nr:MAG: DUF262 domain-containing protein [Treponemataceae bacterium]
MSDVSLALRLAGTIEGKFVVPSYQRGYRWNEEVTALLQDIDNIPEGENYCLQPIVVKRLGEKRFELIDGQQRLTTIYLIMRYIGIFLPKTQIKFSLDYETRGGSISFLHDINFENLNIDENTLKMDEYFMYNAAKHIHRWFENKSDPNQTAIDINSKLNKKINVIWYEVDSDEDSVSLFTRLNIGRIPLTNAELVKALFLSRKSGIDESKQLEIITNWDIIEKELHNDNLWYFITNEPPACYPSRIELVFDLMAGEPSHSRDKFHTFSRFNKMIEDAKEEKNPENSNAQLIVWNEIYRYFQRLKEWHEDRNVYHKIGYLITAGSRLQDFVERSKIMPKSKFQKTLNEDIARTIQFDEEYADLSYEINYKEIKLLLLLFNVETTRQINDSSLRFPFEKYKDENWSLEHIHAIHSEGLNKKEQWTSWLELHLESLAGIDAEENLIAEIKSAIHDKNLDGNRFAELSSKIISLLSAENEAGSGYIHTLSNMALLGQPENSALSNAVFDVKRNRIIEMDKTGAYIPVCTKMVFMKYYTPSEHNQIHFWGEEDRKAYLDNMNDKLKNYLSILQKEILP